MSQASFFDMARSLFRIGLAEVDQKRAWYLALGVFLTVLGSVASGMVITGTMLSVVVLGWILLGAGAGLVGVSFLTGTWSGFLLTLAAGVLSVSAATAILSYPRSGAAELSLMIATM